MTGRMHTEALRRHAATLLLIGLYCALVAPTVATMLLALRENGLSLDLPYAVMLAPLAIVLGGPGAFLLGVVFGWMLLVLAGMGIGGLAVRVGLAVLVASTAWWLADPLPGAQAPSPAADWLVWAGSAAVTALLFTRAWVAHRRMPTTKGD